ncbi:hypothetical protein JXJ21_17775 [candidate division KSB1 bacterium]|nr:hypothetical protein [candidate division KSB1 bacterium]
MNKLRISTLAVLLTITLVFCSLTPAFSGSNLKLEAGSTFVFQTCHRASIHPIIKILQATDNPLSLIASARKLIPISKLKSLTLKATASPGSRRSDRVTYSGSIINSGNPILWILFANYSIVFFVSFLILYRTRSNRSKIKVLRTGNHLNRRKINR